MIEMTFVTDETGGNENLMRMNNLKLFILEKKLICSEIYRIY